MKRVDIAELFERFGVPFYLKIDIEGVDRHALQTVQKLSCRPQYISIESEKRDSRKLISELNQFRNLGYSKYKIVQQKRIPNTEITSRDLKGI